MDLYMCWACTPSAALPRCSLTRIFCHTTNTTAATATGGSEGGAEDAPTDAPKADAGGATDAAPAKVWKRGELCDEPATCGGAAME